MYGEAEVVARMLIGTDRDIEDVCSEEGIDFYAFLDYGLPYLTDMVFMCEECGCWRSIDDWYKQDAKKREICKFCK